MQFANLLIFGGLKTTRNEQQNPFLKAFNLQINHVLILQFHMLTSLQHLILIHLMLQNRECAVGGAGGANNLERFCSNDDVTEMMSSSSLPNIAPPKKFAGGLPTQAQERVKIAI